MSRKTYTAEFKLRATQTMAEQGLALTEVARRLGVSEGCLRAWRDAARDKGDAAFPGRGRPSPGDEELLRLPAENRRPRAERDLRKEAAADFASPPP